MDPITIAVSLAQFAPQLIRWLTGSDKDAAIAQRAVDVAQAVTGAPHGRAALDALQADPALVTRYQQAMLEQQTTFEQLAAQAAADVGATMRAEAASEHWVTYSWRPMIGYAVAINIAGSSLVVLIAYGGVILGGHDPQPLSYLPQMLGAMAALVGVATPILGIASWFRGRMQCDPNLPAKGNK